MKILVLSDSHSAMEFMHQCIDYVRPDAVIHLGDHYRDGKAMAEEYPHIPFYLVPGNCDRFCYDVADPDIRVIVLGGVRMYLTHGHRHGVKSGLWSLKRDAFLAETQVALFGHTHSPCCVFEDGLWLINPGSCGAYGSTAAVLTLRSGSLLDCHILSQSEVKERLIPARKTK